MTTFTQNENRAFYPDLPDWPVPVAAFLSLDKAHASCFDDAMNYHDSLPGFLLQQLRLQPEGLSEYQLINLLRQQQWPLFAEADLRDPLSLFRTHFTLFNALYRLDEQLVADQLQLDISPLCIRLLPRSASQPELTRTDPLRSYYLDLQQLNETDREQVAAMLDGSFSRIHEKDEQTAALACLGFVGVQPLPTAGEIRQAYRRLASRHHPDRGGCNQRLQQINQAMALLKRHQLA